MIVAANFKMNKTRKEVEEYTKVLDVVNFGNVNVSVFPPCSALISKDYIGVQNAYPAKNGAYTGEIGLEQIKEFSINKILIGHSERRHILKESQKFIVEKFEFYKNEGFEIYYCIGEPLEVRKKGIDEVIQYLKAQLVGIDLNYERLIIAYEPVWAIGTGVSASNEEIKETHKEIKKLANRPLLYGGSVKPENVKDILSIENVDGVLVGSASLDVSNFIKMIEIAKEVQKEK
ncbi:triosephosphate isomerase [Nautilia profundicola AmH]|uniref:Triosephosphate isomerase n=1 Tax=Nautilia profundicola (strain ATCC BAA-1463 / DSM 18972 / AmH) TaxID=598659 RepID=B9L8C4_NAUPA|nr:triose-phosphate isomerase [Nautilia profundicola]ACM93633.1 triosephosphate isomerase [Nautilia profundicola AmH]